jgi:hypothetical protein
LLLIREKLLATMTKQKNCSAFTDDDILFLREYENVMSSVAVALDRIQGEKLAYLGCLLPIVSHTYKKLVELKSGELCYCRPLIEALISGFDKRLMTLSDNLEYQLAAAFHPRFRLFWLNPCDPESAQTMQRVRTHMETVLVEALNESDTKFSGGPRIEEEDDDPFMAEMFRQSERSMNSERSARNKAQELLAAWLGGVTKVDYSNETFLNEPALVSLFIKYNTAIPSSAAVERLFSVGKDILRAKRSSLSDANFNTLMFLTGNKHIKLPGY